MTTWFVSRHPGAIEWAAAKGIQVDKHIPHLDPSLVRAGDTVIGTLPVHLAAAVCKQGASFLNLSIDVPPHLRGREISAEVLLECNARLEAYLVTNCLTP